MFSPKNYLTISAIFKNTLSFHNFTAPWLSLVEHTTDIEASDFERNREVRDSKPITLGERMSEGYSLRSIPLIAKWCNGVKVPAGPPFFLLKNSHHTPKARYYFKEMTILLD